MEKKEIPVLLLTGYLGSGKTTLLNRILANEKGIRFAVIVNDIGEVNIDADLIQKGGVVGKKDESLIALQNGCICCTLKADLIEQIYEIMRMQKFDYIVIEASGICEPEPIARTICSIPTFGGLYTKYGICRLDNIVTVVDAMRMQSEFDCGDTLVMKNIDEEDIENLVIQQIEFCNTVLLNKASEVSPKELERIKAIIRELQPKAEIIECNYADVELDKLLDTHLFDYDKVSASAGWIKGIETSEEDAHKAEHEEDEDEEHDHHHEEVGGHHHHHHHEHEGGEVEEYGIGTFVYCRRPAFDMNKFDNFVAKKWSRNIIRAKGLCYFSDDTDMSYLFEQAGRQFQLKAAGKWYATAPEEDLKEIARQDPDFMKDWDPKYGDRMQKLVFIGQHLDKEQITKDLDFCLVSEE
ncbi:MAG: GTP-binding protein [Candidatus Cryptobacteroides sp.]|nr:GTP-binding protein [Bacteroidales bacterium]MDY2774606.1 GTP-binding protein [Candidatus Cryptobacteroides sp.]